jgi:hypothetical protein
MSAMPNIVPISELRQDASAIVKRGSSPSMAGPRPSSRAPEPTSAPSVTCRSCASSPKERPTSRPASAST